MFLANILQNFLLVRSDQVASKNWLKKETYPGSRSRRAFAGRGGSF